MSMPVYLNTTLSKTLTRPNPRPICRLLPSSAKLVSMTPASGSKYPERRCDSCTTFSVHRCSYGISRSSTPVLLEAIDLFFAHSLLRLSFLPTVISCTLSLAHYIIIDGNCKLLMMARDLNPRLVPEQKRKSFYPTIFGHCINLYMYLQAFFATAFLLWIVPPTLLTQKGKRVPPPWLPQ